MSWTVAVGVDTHKQTHTAYALDRLGPPLGTLEISASGGAGGAAGEGLTELGGRPATSPRPLREQLGQLPADALVRACLRLRPRPDDQPRAIARRIGKRIQQLEQELALVHDALSALINELAPELLAEYGVGPFCAAQLLVSAGDPSRFHNEAAFARLAGVS